MGSSSWDSNWTQREMFIYFSLLIYSKLWYLDEIWTNIHTLSLTLAHCTQNSLYVYGSELIMIYWLNLRIIESEQSFLCIQVFFLFQKNLLLFITRFWISNKRVSNLWKQQIRRILWTSEFILQHLKYFQWKNDKMYIF